MSSSHEPSATAAVAPDAPRSTAVRVLTHPLLRLAVLLALVASVAVGTVQGDGVTVDGLRGRVEGLGAVAPAVYIGLFGVATTPCCPQRRSPSPPGCSSVRSPARSSP